MLEPTRERELPALLGGLVDLAVAKLMDYEPGGRGPRGCLFHWGALTDRGLRVTNVWETKEEFEQYAQEKIGPDTQQVGIPGPPRITFYDVHNYQVASVPTK
jgi:hypothetical protein